MGKRYSFGYIWIIGKKKRYEAIKDSIPEATRISLENVFEVEYTHHSTAIEGNTLTLMETKVVLEDGIAIGGASHTPPAGNEMYAQIKNFYVELSGKKGLNDIELTARTHAEFVRIHPFLDGNGRTSRLLMNYWLMENGFLPIYIAKYNAPDQYAAHGRLDDFADMIALLEEKKLNKYLKLAAI